MNEKNIGRTREKPGTRKTPNRGRQCKPFRDERLNPLARGVVLGTTELRYPAQGTLEAWAD
jgi:hypothetical protein